MSLLSRLAVQAARAYGVLSSKSTNVAADYLVVAGGGSGGSGSRGGAGGAGGFKTSTATLSLLTTYTVTVGAGGALSLTWSDSDSGVAQGTNGSNSVLSGTGLTTITSTGGGGGGGNDASGTTQNGLNGGSGGGSWYDGTAGTGISGQGNNGGTGSTSPSYGSGGGGGSGGVGGNGTTTVGGNGGAGTASSISGSSVTYAGGGSGCTYNGTSAGTTTGGGGVGKNTSPNNQAGTSGTANLGGGGGAGGSGGSGIVIISYTSATPKFIGGTITTSGGNQIHTFTSSGTLSPLTPVTASYLVVAGGGGGGSNHAGGGGAGGYLESTATLYSGATYVVTVGAGGAGGTSSNIGGSGTNSVLSGTGLTTVTSIGGGGGAAANGNAANGGSGGGAHRDRSTPGTGTSGQGNNGGGVSGSSGSIGGGGGGGSGSVGGNGSGANGGTGGSGTTSSISGSSVARAGGGGGGSYNGTGGSASSGGGAGGTSAGGFAGTVNTGGGGGGGDTSVDVGGTGGSGTVIISYAGSQVFNGGLVTSSGGNTIHTFNATGALTPLTNNLTNSLRFRKSASAYLSRTFSANPSTRTKCHWHWIVKRGQLGSDQRMFSGYSGTSGDSTFLNFKSDDTFQFNVGGSNGTLVTTAVFRDPSAWYILDLAFDSTQAVAANRAKFWVNGVQQTWAGGTVTLNSVTEFALANANNRVGSNWDSSLTFDGYMADINFIDGQASEPYYFGNNDANGVWKPIKYTGMYGTNGFYLTFADTTSTTTLGYDTSGNNNNWTTNNISLTAGVTYDAMTDVPTNTSATVANYATLNPLQVASATLSNANLSMVRSATGYGETSSTFSPEGNKGYFEITRSSTGDHLAGFILNSISPSTNNYTASGCYWYQCDTGNVRYGTGGSTATLITGCTSAPTGSQIIMVAFDFTGGNRNVWFGLQGTWGVNASSQTGVPSTGAFPHLTTTQLTDICRLYFSNGDTNAFSINFGQRPFSYTPPTGFVALNTFNLPTPTILQGNKYMDATLYTGNGSTQVVVNQGQFKPDAIWIKTRSAGAYNHHLIDSVRGVTKNLRPNLTGAEDTVTDQVTAINSNGFTLGKDTAGPADSEVNVNGNTYVGWQWQAGQGSTSSNTQGSITSTVSVNTTAGFSVVTYTGTGANATVGHGLGVAPKMIFFKQRSGGTARAWQVYHVAMGNGGGAYLNQTNAYSADATAFNNTSPTSSVFSLGSSIYPNQSGSPIVAYCWAEIAGFSKFGSYTGNGSTDGPFIYTGFRPKFVMIKRTDATDDWVILDTSRNTYNVMGNELYPDLSSAEGTGYSSFDYLSNGFKNRSTGTRFNANGGTYIYMAFAENPFKNANAR